MAGEWRELPFSEAVLINPPVRLERGKKYPFVDMGALNPGARSAFATEEREFSGGGSRFEHGDTLMARITPCLENGKIARFCALQGSGVGHGSTEFIVIRGRPSVTYSDFAYYLTLWKGVRGYAISHMTGTSGRQRVPTDCLQHLTVPIPPLPEQRAIAHILGTLDDRIELNRRMSQTLEAMARALFKAWFVDFEPVRAKMEGRWQRGQSLPGLPAHLYDLFPDRLVDWELGEIPEGWEVGTLGDIADVNWGDTKITKTFYVENGYPAYSAKGQDGYLPYYDFNRTGVVVSAIGANSGATWLALGKWSCIKNTLRFWATSEDVSTEYLFFATYGNEKWPIRGSAQPFIAQGDAKAMKILIPQNKLAIKFAEIVRLMIEKKKHNDDESRTLAALRDALLPKLISGEIRVKDAKRFLGRAM
jgi:type I restriction enzyme S subunit